MAEIYRTNKSKPVVVSAQEKAEYLIANGYPVDNEDFDDLVKRIEDADLKIAKKEKEDAAADESK